MAARERVEIDVIGRDVGGSKAFRDVGAAAKDAGDKIEDSGEKATKAAVKYAGLAHEIAQVEGDVRRLAAEIDATGNFDLVKDFDAQKRQLRKLTRVRDLLPSDDESHEEAIKFGARLAENIASGLSRAGGPISAAISNVFGTLPPQAQAAIGAGVVAAVASVGPLVGAAVGGAVVGAAGAGGIVGGIAIAAKDPQVQAAAKLTGDTFTEELQRAAVSFVPATVESLSIVRSQISGLGDDLERAFSASSQMLPGLTEDVMAGATRAVEGFATAVERSGPVVEVIGDIARRAGDVIGDTFEGLSEHAEEGADALAALWAVMEFGIRSVAGTVEMLTALYGKVEKFTFLLQVLSHVTRGEKDANEGAGELKKGLEGLAGGFTSTEVKAGAATVKVESFGDAVKRMAGENISAEQASIRLEEAIDRATEAGKRNNDGIDRGTEKGRANRQLLLDLASAANQSAESIVKQTGSQELASAATERGRKKFLEAADAMGVEKGEAQRLANQLFAIPEQVNSTVTVTANTQPAIDDARSVVARINNMHARISVSAQGTTSFGGSAHTGEGYSTGMSEGGQVGGAGPLGVDSQWRKLAPDEYVVRGAAARAIGYDTLDRLNQADRRPVALTSRSASPGAASGSSGGGWSPDDLYRAMVRALQTVPVTRTDSARMADLYGRTG